MAVVGVSFVALIVIIRRLIVISGPKARASSIKSNRDGMGRVEVVAIVVELDFHDAIV